MHAGVPYLRNRHLYSLSMPNSLNFAFHYHTFVQVQHPTQATPASVCASGTVDMPFLMCLDIEAGVSVLQAALYVISPLALYQLYTYMLSQRSKRLANDRKQGKAA